MQITAQYPARRSASPVQRAANSNRLAVENLLGAPSASEILHEYDLIKSRLLFMESAGDFPRILSSLRLRTDSLKPTDRVFFVAYFSKLCHDEARSRHFGETVQWEKLLGIAEKEASAGRRIGTYDILASGGMNLEKGKVCSCTSAQFLKAFLFRNVYAISVDLPEKQAIASARVDDIRHFVQNVEGSIKISQGERQRLARHCEHFLWRRELHQKDMQEGIHRMVDSNDYWDVFNGLSGERYLVKMGEAHIGVYPCRKQKAYAKGLNIQGLPLYVDVGEFNLYSPSENAFYRAKMESGEIVGACHSKTVVPSSELGGFFRQVMQK